MNHQNLIDTVTRAGAQLVYVIDATKLSLIATNEVDPKYETLLSELNWDGSATSVTFKDTKYFMIVREPNEYKAKKGPKVIVLKKHKDMIYLFETSNNDESNINHVFEKFFE